jgi:hypothetical protein
MTDAEIRARAEELGMVSENALLLSQAQKLADDAAEKAKAAVSTDKAAASGASGNKVSGNAVSGNKISGNKISANKVSGNTASGNTGSSAALKAGSKEDKTAGSGLKSRTREAVTLGAMDEMVYKSLPAPMPDARPMMVTEDYAVAEEMPARELPGGAVSNNVAAGMLTAAVLMPVQVHAGEKETKLQT